MIPASQRLHPLSTEEFRVLSMYGEGCTYADIVIATNKAWKTVRNQLETARKKLHCHTSRQAYEELQKYMERERRRR